MFASFASTLTKRAIALDGHVFERLVQIELRKL
jgi:hypothetical protein